jgi:hypothetical protein
MPPTDLRARVLAAAAAERVPPRPVGARRRAVTLGVGFAASVLLSVLIGLPGTGGRPCAYVTAITIAWGAVAMAATLWGVARGRSMLGRSTAWRVGVAVATPLMLLATAVTLAMFWPATLDDPAGMHAHAVCCFYTTLFAAGPLLAFAFVRRESDPVSPGLTGAALGAAAGAWGALGIELHCAHAGMVHVVLGHVLPVLGLTVLGVLLGRRVVATR